MENEAQPVTPITQPTVQTPMSVKPTSNKSNWLKIVLFSVLGLLLLTGAVYAGIQIGKNQTTNQQPIVIKPTTSPTQTAINPTGSPVIPSPTTDPTADWKTYNMPSYSVKAPQYFTDRRGDGVMEDYLMLTEPDLPGKTPEKGVDIIFGFEFGNGIVKCATNKDCFDYLNLSIKGAESAGSKTITTQTSSTISGQTINGFRQSYNSPDNFNRTMVSIIYPISHNGNLFKIEINAFGKSEIEINQYLDTVNINQILSTFKFTN